MKDEKNNSPDISSLNISIDGIAYTAKQDTRFSWDLSFWRIFRGGEFFALVEYCNKKGWIGTFGLKPSRKALWMINEVGNSIESLITHFIEIRNTEKEIVSLRCRLKSLKTGFTTQHNPFRGDWM